MKPNDRRAIWLLAGVSLALQLPFLTRSFSSLDEGSMLAIAEALANGKVLYRDQATFIGPLMYEWMGVLFRLFGTSLLIGRIFQALVLTGNVLLCYLILRSFAGIRWAAISALALCVLKPLAIPLWTIPNYSQLGMLFALAACVFALRAVERHDPRPLVLAGLAIGLTVVTKLSLGAAVALPIAGAVAVQALRSDAPRVRQLCTRGATLIAAALVPVVVTVGWYAAHGAADEFVDRTVFALGGVSADMRVPLPPLGSWSERASEIFQLQYQYFPSLVVNWLFESDARVYESWRGPLLEAAVKLLYYGTLGAVAVAAALSVWMLRAPDGAGAACRWLVLAGFSGLAYLSTAHRLDFTHLMNIAPALLLVVAIVLHQFFARSFRVALPLLLLAGWCGAGALAAAAVFDVHDTLLETPRGRLYANDQEAADARLLLDFVAEKPDAARIVFMRSIPIFYFLTGRPIVGAFDLYLPGYFRDGDDDRAAREIRASDLVVYNPNDDLTIPKSITEFAPETARALAQDFEMSRLLTPEAIVFERKAFGAIGSGDGIQIVHDFEHISTRAPEGRVERADWLVYPVITATVDVGERVTCFEYPHRPAAGDVLSVRPMFKHEAWTRRRWPDAARRVHVSVEARSQGLVAPLYRARLVAGLPDPPVQIPLDAWAGHPTVLRFCAKRMRGETGKATVGWADPRILRLGGEH